MNPTEHATAVDQFVTERLGGEATQTPPAQTRQLTTVEKKRMYNARMRARNIAKGLTSAGKPRKTNRPYAPRPERRISVTKRLYPSTNRTYKRKLYLQQKRRFAAMGLTAQGKPFKRMSPHGLKNIRLAQKARRERESMLNGASLQPEQAPAPDYFGQAANSIMIAAEVIRDVAMGAKLKGRIQ